VKTHWKYSEFHKWFYVGRVIGTWQAIRQMCIRNNWKIRKINGHRIQLSIWSVTCSSLVQEDISHGIHKVIHKWNFFLELKGTYRFM